MSQQTQPSNGHVKNVIFDLGGVLLHWDIDHIVNSVFDDEATRAIVRREVFGHPDWLDLDRGVLDEADALARISDRTGLSLADAERVMLAAKEELTPVPAVFDVLEEVKRCGVGLYCLSNLHETFYTYLSAKYDFWRNFDGIVISAHVKMIKPDAGIYRHLLSEFGLAAGQTAFIDDRPENIEGACEVGIRGILFTNPAACRARLGEVLPC